MAEIPPEILRLREKWKFRGATRPEFAVEPGPDQESVWDYPRPPRIEPDSRHVVVRADSTLIAETRDALRVLETASPPTFYLPRGDVRTQHLVRSKKTTLCEWKGRATYWSVRVGDLLLEDAAWSYPAPFPGYETLTDYFSFYPTRLGCWVDDKRVEPQAGGYYGGWVTREIVGPMKGEPGSDWW